MISVGIKELKANLSAYVKQVQGGEEVVITDRGREVARVVPISAGRQGVNELLTSGKARWAGGKPKGALGIRLRGEALSDTIVEERG